MRNTPKWAQLLVERVWRDEGRSGQLPAVNWRRSSLYSSSGTAWPSKNRLTINAGRGRHDHKLVLLHELAHLLTTHKHSSAFWDKAWELFRRYGVSVKYAKEREGTYRAGALIAYRRHVKAKAKARRNRKAPTVVTPKVVAPPAAPVVMPIVQVIEPVAAVTCPKCNYTWKPRKPNPTWCANFKCARKLVKATA